MYVPQKRRGKRPAAVTTSAEEEVKTTNSNASKKAKVDAKSNEKKEELDSE